MLYGARKRVLDNYLIIASKYCNYLIIAIIT